VFAVALEHLHAPLIAAIPHRRRWRLDIRNSCRPVAARRT
jgi:hypothetical protein